MENTERFLVSNVKIETRFQARGRNDEETVEAYKELLLAQELPNTWPFREACILFDVDGDFYLVDGFHRYAACKRAGRRYLLADVKLGTYDEAFEYALGANASHGLQRTTADKRHAVQLALNDDRIAKFSNRKIAKVCNVSEYLVRQMRPAPPKSSTVDEGAGAINRTNDELAEDSQPKQSQLFASQTQTEAPPESHHVDHTVTPPADPKEPPAVEETPKATSEDPPAGPVNGVAVNIRDATKAIYTKFGFVVRNLEMVGMAKGDPETFQSIKNELGETFEKIEKWTGVNFND